ncbi:MAG: aldehyde dehydrogenase [Pleurocapsa sp. MO_226.B13]|nr:aldehyde dehydrogenase [Pleurocapsa sp. MO_226.B13]
MTNTLIPPKESITQTIEQQREFFGRGKTKDFDFRRQQLENLKAAIKKHERGIIAALHQDLGKPELEGYVEIAVLQEINFALKHLKSWMKREKVKAPLTQFPASAYIYSEPLGNVLIIGPWNYPFSLMISPLIGAIAAGNCAILKPSEIAPETSKILTQLINDTFDPAYIHSIEGGVETSQALLAQNFDHIFFTGGTKVGKIVMEAAAKNLTPVTLELGGKSPCIIDRNIDLKETAKRITWGKFLNAGQTCIAPDYLLVDKQIKTQLIEAIKQCLRDFYGDNPKESPDLARIINAKQFNRLQGLLSDGEIVLGGETDAEDLYIAPTLITNVTQDCSLMQEEIFGPILPILEYDNLQEAIATINSRPKPLALYIFSKNKDIQQQVLLNTSSGGVCINDTIVQVGVNELPFGGVGDSGIGNYHGKASFDTFSHQKSVLKKSFWFDFNWRYAPYADKLNLFKKITQ